MLVTKYISVQPMLSEWFEYSRVHGVTIPVFNSTAWPPYFLVGVEFASRKARTEWIHEMRITCGVKRVITLCSHRGLETKILQNIGALGSRWVRHAQKLLYIVFVAVTLV